MQLAGIARGRRRVQLPDISGVFLWVPPVSLSFLVFKKATDVKFSALKRNLCKFHVRMIKRNWENLKKHTVRIVYLRTLCMFNYYVTFRSEKPLILMINSWKPAREEGGGRRIVKGREEKWANSTCVKRSTHYTHTHRNVQLYTSI